MENGVKQICKEYSPEYYGEIIDYPMDISKVYKFVKEKDGVLYSNYKNSFKYVVGENASDNSNGLFFYYKDGIAYCNREYTFNNRVMIECEVIKRKYGGDLPDSSVVCSEVKVLRIVPPNEIEAILKELENSSVASPEMFPF